MICCALVAGLLGLLGLPVLRLRPTPLAWRLTPTPAAPTSALVLRLRSFGYALAGLHALVRDEPNARIHCAAAVAAIVTGAALGISPADWRWLVLAIAMVLAAECFNTAIERTCDVASPAHHPLVKVAKDVAAGGVLLTAAAALLIGMLTFWPYVVGLYRPAVAMCSHAGLFSHLF